MDIAEEDVKVRMAMCQQCNNAVLVAIVHSIDKETNRDFAKLVSEGCDIKTISLLEYREQNIQLYCDSDCSFKTKK